MTVQEQCQQAYRERQELRRGDDLVPAATCKKTRLREELPNPGGLTIPPVKWTLIGCECGGCV